MAYKRQICSSSSKNSVWIVDALTVTSMGMTFADLWRGLMAGKSAIEPIERFPVERYECSLAACIEDLSTAGPQSMTHSLIDLILEQLFPIPKDSFLITATTKSGIDNLEKICRKEFVHQEDVLLSSVGKRLASKLGLTTNGINISAACASSTIALGRGAALIESGRTDTVLICCLDILSEFVFSGFSSLKALSPKPCQPYDKDRKGLSLGEGAAVLLLMSEKRAKEINRDPLGRLLGWGAANDAAHITAPHREGLGLIEAINRCLIKAGLDKNRVAAVSGHGTGTVYNDMMELTAIKSVFKDTSVPLYSIKGAIGHTLGATGGIEVIVGLKALKEQVVPPTIGLVNPEKDAIGKVSPEPVPISGDFLLTMNSGFGGINGALLLGKGEDF